MKVYKAWDLPVRLFHWSLVAAILVSWYTIKTSGQPLAFPVEWHARAGYTILALLVFRWLWSLVGSRHARLRELCRSPRTVWRYTASWFRRRPDLYVGHNPLGGWMTLLLLVSLTLQATSGLFMSDGILFSAPLARRFEADAIAWLVTLHHVNGNLLFVLVGIHLLAILLHRLRGEALVGAMFSGRKRLARPVRDGDDQPVSGWRAWASASIAVLALTAILEWL
ncbi:cytochrome b/b6 domain-containing protein [Modicisalibacter tunisiensis]|uniref:Cytochrome b/b6 domain-containing protein n=1 Tax=Modicisalibacter tunisiensis TaxID=390637 RepID=A0ABS7X0Q7_9GAMM|nr:cytochrome b/b6 domain-containing protein [Modicisalibacter tunisiensis]MBZ9538115.1 cytochrome b/b6 domain-containing protein [Modicisalibacter tunisiensis]MBZ9568475.1 cytochrome b/b6 domain-containing protein [Modicisalibacter tunisiensis]